MLPYKTIIQLQRAASKPLYLQLAEEIIKRITSGMIPAKTKLPGARKMAGLLDVSRKTVLRAYEELEVQAWIVIEPNRGCFVSAKMPSMRPSKLPLTEVRHRENKRLGFELDDRFSFITPNAPNTTQGVICKLDDGYPDVRLAPLKELAKNMSYLVSTPKTTQLMTYHQAYQGDIQLRRALAKYLTETRGIHVEVSNILITRGSLMAFYLLFQNLLSPGDKVIVGNPGFNEAHNSIRLAQGQLVRVAVDEEGMDVDAVERICKKERIRAVYIVPHHHYPTTVALSAERRMRLLLLAERYGFATIEDDYDYDFHYSSSPVLPMASSDYAGTVAYVGSFSKTIAPSLRIGFIVAPEALIQALTKFSRFVDSHGNTALERAVAMLFANGEINRHLKKATTIYRNRRDHCCAMLQKELGPFIDFNVPEGGLAVWVKFKPPLSIQQLHQKAAQIGLRFPDTHLFCPPNETLNATRIGFASRTPEEMTNAIKLLQQLTKITSKPNKITN